MNDHDDIRTYLMNQGFKPYARSGTTLMRPYVPGEFLEGITVTDADMKNLQPGDMIAVNRDAPTDQWLVSKRYFEANYQELPAQDLWVPRFHREPEPHETDKDGWCWWLLPLREEPPGLRETQVVRVICSPAAVPPHQATHWFPKREPSPPSPPA